MCCRCRHVLQVALQCCLTWTLSIPWEDIMLARLDISCLSAWGSKSIGIRTHIGKRLYAMDILYEIDKHTEILYQTRLTKSLPMFPHSDICRCADDLGGSSVRNVAELRVDRHTDTTWDVTYIDIPCDITYITWQCMHMVHDCDCYDIDIAYITWQIGLLLSHAMSHTLHDKSIGKQISHGMSHTSHGLSTQSMSLPCDMRKPFNLSFVRI